jgi:hypothetical protein
MTDDNNEGKQWYVVESYFIARCDGMLPTDALVEEVHFLVQGSSHEEAETASLKVAKGMEHSYPNMYDQVVSWEVLRVEEPKPIGSEFKTGMEVFSRFLSVQTYQTLIAQPEDRSQSQ